MITAVAYLRVSTDGQAQEDRFGLQVQREDIDKYAKQNNINIIKYYIESGVSGSKLDRPELNELLKDSENKNFKALIVAKLDRVARDLMAQLFIEKELLKNDIEIISVAEPMRAEDATGQLFRHIIGAFAQFERARINERMTGGRLLKARKGSYSGGRPAIGYTADKNTQSLKVNPDKTEAVRLVFKLREQGLIFQAIADKLNESGHTTALNKPFSKVQVKRIYDRKELYSGLYKYADIQAQGQHEAILTA